MTVKAKSGARDKILAAAEELARQVGPAHLALDAVAARAGVSKGGLLYHFPSKGELLQALVKRHMDMIRQDMAQRLGERGDGPDAMLLAYLDAVSSELSRHRPPQSGVLAAMVENPEMLEPIKRFKRDMLDGLVANARDGSTALVVFLALEGLGSLKLCDLDILTDAESERSIRALTAMIAA